MKQKGFWLIVLVCVLLASCRFVNPLMIRLENDRPSVSHGLSWDGDLDNGKRLPNSGENFQCVSYFLTALGRNGVHHELREVVVNTYDSLYALNPEWCYLYGETGWVNGGKFFPHYTHQNGLVVDFMVPVINADDSLVNELSTHPFNRWGYAYEFDSSGRAGKLSIDFESLGAHLYLLQEMASKHNMKISRIIFEPKYLDKLYATRYGPLLKDIDFVYNKGWGRHDDHYHTEFTFLTPE